MYLEVHGKVMDILPLTTLYSGTPSPPPLSVILYQLQWTTPFSSNRTRMYYSFHADWTCADDCLMEKKIWLVYSTSSYHTQDTCHTQDTWSGEVLFVLVMKQIFTVKILIAITILTLIWLTKAYAILSHIPTLKYMSCLLECIWRSRKHWLDHLITTSKL